MNSDLHNKSLELTAKPIHAYRRLGVLERMVAGFIGRGNSTYVLFENRDYSGSAGTAAEKLAALKAAGAAIARSPAEIGATVQEVLKR